MTDQGVWIAYYSDWSAVVVFANEMECLRVAVERTMNVAHVPYGTDLSEGVKAYEAAKRTVI